MVSFLWFNKSNKLQIVGSIMLQMMYSANVKFSMEVKEIEFFIKLELWSFRLLHLIWTKFESA